MEPVQTAQEDDRFAALFTAHAERARALIRRRLGESLRRRYESHDVLQEVYLEASRLPAARCVTEEPAGFLPWLLKLIEFKVLNLARAIRAERRDIGREQPLELLGGAPAVRSRAPTPSAELISAERAAILERALGKLSPREREVVVLVYYEGLLPREAALLLGKTRNATQVLLCHALRKVRVFMEGCEL